MSQKIKSKKHKRVDAAPISFPILRVIGIFVVTILFLLIPSQNAYSFRAATETYQIKDELVAPPAAPYPQKLTQTFPPEVTAGGVLIVDVNSGVVLFEKNPDLRLFPASTTKIMTALVALEDYALDDVVTLETVVTEGQVIGLVKGETITVENLLYGILVHSGNDAAYALAQHHEGGVEKFIERMNTKAQELHLNNTHFTNSIGLDDPNHYTTPRDLARLSLVALKNHTIVKIVAVPQITISDTTFLHFHPLKNVNELLGKIPGVSGFKTGWTEHAGQSLITTVTRNGHRVMIVILKSSDRFGETEILLNWIFANFDWRNMSFEN